MINSQLEQQVAAALLNPEVANWYAVEFGINSAADVTDTVLARQIIADAQQ
jgi:hypothetical protein